MNIMKWRDALRRLRETLTGLGYVHARVDSLQNKLDAFRLALEELVVSEAVRNESISVGKSGIDDVGHEHVPGVGLSSSDRADLVQVTPIESGERLRIVLVAQHAAIWPSLHSVWKAAVSDPRFDVKVLIAPYIHHLASASVTLDDLREYFMANNVPYAYSEQFNLGAYKPHVVFLPTPYESTRPENLTINKIKEAGARIAYVPYGLELGGGAWNVRAQFNSTLHNSAWRVFVRSEHSRKMYGKHCQVGNHHVVVSGHPKFDINLVGERPPGGGSYKTKIGDRKVVLWTPHFSIGAARKWSTYDLYGDAIFDEFKKHEDLFLLIRPHPLFFRAMRARARGGSSEELGFRQRIDLSDNMALDEELDYHSAFSVADALMADVGSFMLEFLPTQKPILYLHCHDGLGMNDGGELAQVLYRATGVVDIVKFIDMVRNESDPMCDERLASIPEFIYGLSADTTAGERVVDYVYSAISKGDSYSDDGGVGGAKQEQSETYWRNSSNTYLAPPDLYDLCEDALRVALSELPRFSRAIDIGCGDGRYTLQIAASVDRVTGFDTSAHLIERAKEVAVGNGVLNASFYVEELDSLAPEEKFDLVVCMGVTSCLINDFKFLRTLDKFEQLSTCAAYLIMVDTISTDCDKVVEDASGYIAKYRCEEEYLKLVLRRGYRLVTERIIREDSSRDLANKMWVFKRATVNQASIGA